jgi:hypothetical protein
MKNEFRCSFLQFDITPNVAAGNPAFLQGMAGEYRGATSVAIPLSMEICLLEDSNFTKLLFVSADIIGFDQIVVDQVRKHASLWGIDPEGIVLNASHTHYAPGTITNMPDTMGPFYKSYTQEILQRIVTNLQILYDGLESCRIYSGRTNVRIGVNRRYDNGNQVLFAPNPSGAYIQDTPIIKIELKNSKRSIVWVNHGCHPTGMGKDTRISADYPGILKYVLRRKQVADGVMFFQGAAGSCKQAIEMEGQLKFCDNIREVRQNGMKLAEAVKAAADKGLKKVEGSFFCKIQPIELPLAQVAEVENHNKAMSIDVQMVCIGNGATMLTFPMEPVAELAFKIKECEGFGSNDFMLGYTNGLFGYLPTDDILDAGGYEAEQSHLVYQQSEALANGVETLVIESVRKLLNEKDMKGTANGYGHYHRAKSAQKAFFVLSSGRCGTLTLAQLLNTATNARVWHHPNPFLIKETLDAYQKRVDSFRVFWRGRAPFLHKSWAQGLIHGETDHNMTPFADCIVQEIPDSKFIILVRNPYDFVRSGMRRNYYGGHPWDVGRLRPTKKDPEYNAWSNFDQFEKICWLWNRTYQKIRDRVALIPEDRIITVRFEELFEDITHTKNLFNFLKLDGFDTVAINTLMPKKFNKQTSGTFPKKEDWPERYHQILWKHCGEQAQFFGYEAADKRKKLKKSANTTIWDYKKFEHQPFPSNLSPKIIVNQNRKKLIIDKEKKVVSMGSCFARNIALALIQREYNYIITEQPFKEFSAHWGQVFNTSSMRQIFQYTFNENWRPIARWWDKGASVQDPYRRHIIYDKKSCADDFRKHQHASRLALKNADIVILTLGLIETWRDKRDKMTYYRVPSPKLYDEKIHEFYIQSVNDCLDDLNVIHQLMKKHNRSANLIISVSPVPLFATFRKDTDVVSANSFSKATLRVAAEYFCSQHENVFYFPSFEIATQLIENPYETDNRHVTKHAIAQIMDTFIELYSISH